METAIIVKTEKENVVDMEQAQEFVFFDKRDFGDNPMAVVDWEIDSIMRELAK